MVEEMLAARGIDVTYESQQWQGGRLASQEMHAWRHTFRISQHR
jgi:hypothetical protein